MIPALLTFALPFLVTPLVGWLSHDQLAAWLNSVIACVVVMASAIAWALVARSLGPDLVQNALLVAGYTGALLAGPLKPLYVYTTLKWPSPFSALIDKLPSVAKAQSGLVPSASGMPPKLLQYRTATASPAVPPDVGELPTHVELPAVQPPSANGNAG